MVHNLLKDFLNSLLVLLPLSTPDFTYDNPDSWSNDFPQCAGLRQSPVNINTLKSELVNLPLLHFPYYDEYFAENIELTNNGKTVEFEVPETEVGTKPYITGGPLTGDYIAEGVHFHWGSPQFKGSEHKLNGRFYDMEMHIVHRNNKYTTLEAARDYKDGIAVLAVLFKTVKSQNVDFPGLNIIYDALDQVQSYNATTDINVRLPLVSLLGNLNLLDYFTYSGSLTTPPCSEAVTFIVFSSVLPISYLQIQKFWQLVDNRGLKLQNNFRPLQPLNYRKVYHQITHSYY